MRRCFVWFLLLLLLMLKTANAALPATVTIPASAIELSLLALTVSFDVVAIGYIISKIFPQTGVGEWLRNEYWEIAKSAMLIASIYAIVILMTNISSLFVSQTTTGVCLGGAPASYTLINAACSYLDNVTGYLSGTFNNLTDLSGALGAMSGLVIEAYAPLPVPPIAGFKFGFSFSPYKNSLLESTQPSQFQSILSDSITYLAFPVALLVEVQSWVLPYIFVIGLSVLIPIGLVFRAFPFTRGIGGAMVALGIGLSIIYPSVLIIFNNPVTSALQSSLTPISGSCNSSLICGTLTGILSYFSSFNIALNSIGTIFPALDDVLGSAVYMFVQFLLFVLDVGIGYYLANSIANALGGSIRLGIGEKIKLV